MAYDSWTEDAVPLPWRCLEETRVLKLVFDCATVVSDCTPHATLNPRSGCYTTAPISLNVEARVDVR